MAKIDISKLPVRTGSIYPGKLADEMQGRSSIRVGDAGGLSQFGANIIILTPGAKSSLRHWHLKEDEFVMMLEGELQLVENNGETTIIPGDFAAFPAGVEDGHQFVNKTDQEARFLVIGTRSNHEVATYSDIDLRVSIDDGVANFTHKNGTPFDPMLDQNKNV